jgi:hypothetical protein
MSDLPQQCSSAKMDFMEVMDLSTQQIQAIERGEPVRAGLAQTGVEIVVLRADVYDRIKGLIYDDSQWSEAEKLALLRAFGTRAGWDDPELDVYEEFRK